MFDNIFAAIPFGIILSFTIGPVFFVLLETSATKGFKSALIFDSGVILADIFFILIAFFTTNRLMEKIKDDPNFLIFGGVLLVFYGLISFIKTSKSFRAIVKEYHKVEFKKNYGGPPTTHEMFQKKLDDFINGTDDDSEYDDMPSLEPSDFTEQCYMEEVD